MKTMQEELLINQPAHWLADFPWPKRDGHKYDRGHALVVGGNMTHAGAAKLSALAALRTGAGLVSIICNESDCAAYATTALSVMTRLRSDWNASMQDERITTLVIGPGAGVTAQTEKDVLSALAAKKHLVIDADALTVFAGKAELLFNTIHSPCILTPHAGEFKRLFPALAQTERVNAARHAAAESHAVVIYKGAETVIAAPDGRIIINKNAPPNLATAGSGDVLSGICAGLLAQDMEAFKAACAAVWIHGEAANRHGAGLISEDLVAELPAVLQKLKTAS